jgi:hypothetical protein
LCSSPSPQSQGLLEHVAQAIQEVLARVAAAQPVLLLGPGEGGAGDRSLVRVGWVKLDSHGRGYLT